MSASDVHINPCTVHSNIQFIKLLRFIKENPGCTRHDVLTAVRGAECDRPGFYSDYFAYMFNNDYAEMKRDGKQRKYYITAHGEWLLLRAEANGPMPKRIKHNAFIQGTFIPFNPEVLEEYKKLETTVKLINEMHKNRACDPDVYGENFKAMKKAEILEILKKITGTKAGIKSLFSHLHKFTILICHWQKDENGWHKEPAFCLSERALRIAKVWPLIEVNNQM